ncbi:serine hydrolase domain-containing protein [Dyadobacter crusticola]|uniref:serine hydrolase domain-containing protein n=1 Tax=Dyadobacter crusticola TaxID=292407 RepID=UPI0004E21B6A|nr:serine hydrolase domain-containing protein [Dyadobacter crusticola]
MIRKAFYIAFFFLVSLSAFAQQIDKAKLDAYFDALEKNDKFMGSVAISQNGNVIYTRTLGFSNVETRKKPDQNTRYRIGSISKTFTAVLVFKAIEEKKLSLTETLDKYFPGIKNASKITIAQLLAHRSGIHNFTDNADYVKWNTQKKTEAEMVEIVTKGGSDFEPDSKAVYSNSNYLLLTYILEKVNKKPFGALLTEKIFKPAGLTNTALGGKINPANESYSYEYAGKWVKQPETDMSVPAGAGALVSTPTDLTKFADALFGGKLVTPQSLDKMKTLRDNFGMGLFQIPFYEKKSFGHTGGIDGFRSLLGYFPDDKIAYSYITNGAVVVPNNVAIAMLSAVYGKPVDIPEFKTYTPDPADLDKYVGVYASNQIPIKITVSRAGNVLSAQGSGQPAFTLEATDKDKFKFEAGSLSMEFIPAEKKMLLRQGGGVFDFRKE